MTDEWNSRNPPCRQNRCFTIVWVRRGFRRWIRKGRENLAAFLDDLAQTVSWLLPHAQRATVGRCFRKISQHDDGFARSGLPALSQSSERDVVDGTESQWCRTGTDFRLEHLSDDRVGSRRWTKLRFAAIRQSKFSRHARLSLGLAHFVSQLTTDNWFYYNTIAASNAE